MHQLLVIMSCSRNSVEQRYIRNRTHTLTYKYQILSPNYVSFGHGMIGSELAYIQHLMNTIWTTKIENYILLLLA